VFDSLGKAGMSAQLLGPVKEALLAGDVQGLAQRFGFGGGGGGGGGALLILTTGNTTISGKIQAYGGDGGTAGFLLSSLPAALFRYSQSSCQAPKVR